MKNLFKTYTKYITIGAFTFTSVITSSVFAQSPVGYQYVGSQNYSGTQNYAMPQQQIAPTVNSVYAQPMRRINEIPLYGKNKSVYLYDHNKRQEDTNPLADTGLYMFAGFSTGASTSGINSEKATVIDYTYNGGSDANTDMGTGTGFTFGVGRVMNSTLSVEFIYSQYTGMNYGNYAAYYYPDEFEEYDDEGNGTGIYYEENVLYDNTAEVTSGGDISSDFMGVGLRYSLENMFGTVMGMFKPYVGFQIGLTQNTIDDYTINYPYADGNGEYLSTELLEEDVAGIIGTSTTGVGIQAIVEENLNFTMIGTTTSSFGAGIEAGMTMALGGALEMDIFYKYNTYGTIETSGNVYKEYDEVVEDYYILGSVEASCPAEYSYGTTTIPNSSGGVYTICLGNLSSGNVQSLTGNQKESGDMNFTQYGVKLKYMF